MLTAELQFGVGEVAGSFSVEVVESGTSWLKWWESCIDVLDSPGAGYGTEDGGDCCKKKLYRPAICVEWIWLYW